MIVDLGKYRSQRYPTATVPNAFIEVRPILDFGGLWLGVVAGETTPPLRWIVVDHPRTVIEQAQMMRAAYGLPLIIDAEPIDLDGYPGAMP